MCVSHNGVTRLVLTQMCPLLQARSVENPDKPLYRITDWDSTSLGTKAHPKLRAKGAESSTLLYYAVDIVRRFRDSLELGGALEATGKCLAAYLDITRAHGATLPTKALQDMMSNVVRFLAVREMAAIPWLPKMHGMIYLCFQSERFGNPRLLAATWIDESLNMQLAAVCRTANTAVWSRRVVSVMMHPTGPLQKRQRS